MNGNRSRTCQAHNRDITNILLTSSSRSVLYGSRDLHLARTLRAWAINRRGKNLARNLRCGPQTRLVMYQSNQSLNIPPPGNPSALEVLENFCVTRYGVTTSTSGLLSHPPDSFTSVVSLTQLRNCNILHCAKKVKTCNIHAMLYYAERENESNVTLKPS